VPSHLFLISNSRAAYDNTLNQEFAPAATGSARLLNLQQVGFFMCASGPGYGWVSGSDRNRKRSERWRFRTQQQFAKPQGVVQLTRD
jgi:hypothetical protein